MFTLMLNLFDDPSQEYLGVLILSVLASFSVMTIISLFDSIFSKETFSPITESPIDKYLRISQELFDKALDTHHGRINYEAKNLDLSTHIIQQTPIGMIIMSYDNSEKRFLYYTDKTSVTFHILNAVSQHYCAKTRNFDIYTTLSVIEKDLERTNKRYKADPKFKKIVTKQMNTFIRKGPIREFSFLKKIQNNDHDKNHHKNLSFADFKYKFKNDNL